MKTPLRLLFLSAILLATGILFAAPVSDTSNVILDQQVTIEEPIYFGEDVKIVEKAYKTLEKSVLSLDNIMEDPENSIPPSLISKSEGIVIFPSAIKLAVGIAGGQGGRGIAMIRQTDGSWSNPFFVTLGEGSLGLQVGVTSSDIVLLFKDKNDLMDIDKAEITFGSDINVAAGPVSKGSSATSDVNFDSEIYSYSRSKGLFAGISLKGGVMAYNSRVNETLYCTEDITTDDIFYETAAPYNDQVDYLIATINTYGE